MDNWEVTKKKGVFIPADMPKIKEKQGLVEFHLGQRYVKMSTPVSHRIGFALIKEASEALPNESIVLKINGVALEYPPISAKKIGGQMLISTDAADDFQIGVIK